MSLETKRPLAKVLAELDDFTNLIRPNCCCLRWKVAGSIRRQRAEVSDVDIVAIPTCADVPVEGSLLGDTERRNLLWQRVDDLVKLGTFTHHMKETDAGPRPKWGQTCRSIGFRGMAYEITLADEANFGVWLAIRTGPAVMSKELVTRLPLVERGRYRFAGDFHIEERDGMSAPRPIPCPEEADFFRLCGMACPPPHQR